ncbi:MAG TPA: MBL fold metallo-hydrolase [Thermoanaerobaculia bacterium]
MAEFEVTYVNVGHGDSTLIKLPGDRYLLVDVYRCPGQGIDLFRLLDEVLPVGDDGRRRLDVLLITHVHDDHIAGIGDLYDRYQVVELWLPQHARKLQEAAGSYEEFERVRDEHPEEQTRWPKGSRSIWATLGDGGEVSVRCFSPPGYIDPEEDLEADEVERLVHENCVVLRLTYAEYSVMLTGDSNKACWERVVSYYKNRTDGVGVEVLQAQSLKASHHGSRSFIKDDKEDEPYLEALERIQPEHVVISVGPDSKHDHPHDDMVDVYEDSVGADNVLQTRQIGTVRLEVEADGVARLITEEGAEYERKYGWGDDGGGGGKRLRTSLREAPPAVPPPGFHRVPQRGPRRDRYGA